MGEAIPDLAKSTAMECSLASSRQFLQGACRAITECFAIMPEAERGGAGQCAKFIGARCVCSLCVHDVLSTLQGLVGPAQPRVCNHAKVVVDGVVEKVLQKMHGRDGVHLRMQVHSAELGHWLTPNITAQRPQKACTRLHTVLRQPRTSFGLAAV